MMHTEWASMIMGLLKLILCFILRLNQCQCKTESNISFGGKETELNVRLGFVRTGQQNLETQLR